MAEYISFQPRDNFKTHLYTGTGASNAQTFPETTAMQPDLTWIKNRETSDTHIWTDSVRGATKYITSYDGALSVTNAESLKSFDSDGFTVGTMNEVNTNTEDFVSWNWKMGTTSGIAGSPSITPTAYSINATAGQSIITYTGNGSAGATIPHGLGVAPAMVIVKVLSGGAAQWAVGQHKMNTTNPWHYAQQLSENSARLDSATRWNDTAPTSTLVTIGTTDLVNYNTYTYVAYCFTPIKGYSKFDSYTGNGNADGPCIYTGFRPAFLMLKRTDSTGAWFVFDNKRLGHNPNNDRLFANDNNAGADTDCLDILSNGFKIRNTDGDYNLLNGYYIYMAFAESPIVSSNDIPGVAR